MFALLALQFPNTDGLTPATQYISFVRDIEWLFLPVGLYVLWVWFMVAATSNAVNIADGLDGLAAGAASMVFGAYVTVGVMAVQPAVRRHRLAELLRGSQPARPRGDCGWGHGLVFRVPVVERLSGADLHGGHRVARARRRDGRHRDLHPNRAAPAGPGRTVRGDHASVIIQVASFKTTGKRVFLMSPIQHHFELKRWPEVLIVTRFWIVSGSVHWTWLRAVLRRVVGRGRRRVSDVSDWLAHS